MNYSLILCPLSALFSLIRGLECYDGGGPIKTFVALFGLKNFVGSSISLFFEESTYNFSFQYGFSECRQGKY